MASPTKLAIQGERSNVVPLTTPSVCNVVLKSQTGAAMEVVESLTMMDDTRHGSEVVLVAAFRTKYEHTVPTDRILTLEPFVAYNIRGLKRVDNTYGYAGKKVTLLTSNTLSVGAPLDKHDTTMFFTLQKGTSTVSSLRGKYNKNNVLMIVRVAHVERIDQARLKGKLEVYDDSEERVDILVFGDQQAILDTEVGHCILLSGAISKKASTFPGAPETVSVIVKHFNIHLQNLPRATIILKEPHLKTGNDLQHMESISGTRLSLASLIGNKPSQRFQATSSASTATRKTARGLSSTCRNSGIARRAPSGSSTMISRC
jgi:hypothetical protein